MSEFRTEMQYKCTLHFGGLILEHGSVPQLSSFGDKGWGLEVSDFRVWGSGYEN